MNRKKDSTIAKNNSLEFIKDQIDEIMIRFAV